MLAQRLVARYECALATRRTAADLDEDGIDHELVRRVATWEREDTSDESSGENVFGMMRRIGQAKAGLAADYAAQLARSVGKVVFFAKHIDVMDAAEETFEKRGLRYSSIRGDQTRAARERNIKAFVEDPDVAVIVCSLSAAGVGINLQVASNLVLSELSWTDAEQTQAIDRVHRIGQDEPVTAWRIIAAQTIDTKVAELIDSKAGLAARALDGRTIEASSVDVQVEALVALLTDEGRARQLRLSPGPHCDRDSVGQPRPGGICWAKQQVGPRPRSSSAGRPGLPDRLPTRRSSFPGAQRLLGWPSAEGTATCMHDGPETSGPVGGEQWLGVVSAKRRVVPTDAARDAPGPSTTRA